VFIQHDNYGFSVPVVFRSKTQCESKTQNTRFARGASFGQSLVEYRNARLAVNVDKLTEFAIIMLKEH
jgi:hypothetical protein